MQLEGGAFQKLFDEYLYKKYKFKNIQTLGVQTATNKPTKGTPDSYVLTDDGKYILINYGSVSSQPAKKIRDDILACFDKAKLSLPKDKIYVPTDFDTKEKALSEAKTAEKGLK